jgi:hypothetical protein
MVASRKETLAVSMQEIFTLILQSLVRQTQKK